eukprot:CAMPEP_0181179984 /NCGR_PEP_ID=MMETSP1096-20121128/6554_1 /TAXON_ID=156174 ORGANISM="Chrysochromulina ericina, Strain CCMP281" /NCGR_SAMPLE_ID=MMETSP1096 /ASSEMBLY_ACC=CAM_ASM_000453 /LENGTH=84 /DNA_ID=CAMNT_0023268375 /DNA_START=103 /DNA_END=357 /DNA_ORIENTATION=-
MTVWLAPGTSVWRIQLLVAANFCIAAEEQRLIVAGNELNDTSKALQDFLPSFVGTDSHIEVIVDLRDDLPEPVVEEPAVKEQGD